jgi:hypothetical protein
MHQRGDRVQSGQRDNVVREQLMDFLEAVREVPFFHVGDAISTSPKTEAVTECKLHGDPRNAKSRPRTIQEDRGLRQGS